MGLFVYLVPDRARRGVLSQDGFATGADVPSPFRRRSRLRADRNGPGLSVGSDRFIGLRLLSDMCHHLFNELDVFRRARIKRLERSDVAGIRRSGNQEQKHVGIAAKIVRNAVFPAACEVLQVRRAVLLRSPTYAVLTPIERWLFPSSIVVHFPPQSRPFSRNTCIFILVLWI